jgi:hypothetical protein
VADLPLESDVVSERGVDDVLIDAADLTAQGRRHRADHMAA